MKVSEDLRERGKKGITLVALVVTIVVLLILAGITITYVVGENSIFKKAQEAKNRTEEAISNEQTQWGELANKLNGEYGNRTGNGGNSGENTETPNSPTPEGLEVGSTVTYNPSGTYNWQAKYCSSTKTETTDDVTLNSSEANFKISEWKVLSIDEATGKVELVPSSPTTGTVYLGEAQGYNNGVKLLNDACSNLYGNDSKGITARSINIEDIEKYMTEEAKTGENGAYNYVDTDSNTKYGNQVSSAYANFIGNRYPVIYAREKKSVINGATPTDATLDLSDTLDRLIERSEGTSTTSDIGAITTATSIQPYQTFWRKDGTFMKTALGEYTKKDNTKAKYYDLIMPNGTSTKYWMASRCVGASNGNCGFRCEHGELWRCGLHDRIRVLRRR